MKLTDEEIKEIAEDLEIGFRVFVHKDTKKRINIRIVEDEQLMGEEKERDEVEEDPEKYIEFEPMNSREAYRVMERFVNIVEDEAFASKLSDALDRRKPFRKFKDIVESSEYREQWFAFKEAEQIENVREQLEAYNRSESDEMP